MKADTCIANYINGNLDDAKRQAKRIGATSLVNAAILAGKPCQVAQAIALYLKNPCFATWQSACKAENLVDNLS